MPICKKCKDPFPNRLKIGNKYRNLQKRKYCLKCSPFDKHNTSKIHLDKNKIIICPKCGREYIHDHKKGHTLTRCNSCAVNERKIEVKEKAVDYKGGKCKVCGYAKCISALEFHHRDSSTKEFSLSGCHCHSWDKVRKELDKCDLLCCRCHRELHAELIINMGS